MIRQCKEKGYFIAKYSSEEQKANATHYLLNGGILTIPPERHLWFLRLLTEDYHNGVSNSVVERRTPFFKLYFDLDVKMGTVATHDEFVDIARYIVNTVLLKFYHREQLRCIVAYPSVDAPASKFGMHIVFPDIIVNTCQALQLHKYIVVKLKDDYKERYPSVVWSKFVDDSVYKGNGLRMIYQDKYLKRQNIKRPYSVIERWNYGGDTVDTRDTYELFRQTSIKCFGDALECTSREISQEAIVEKIKQVKRKKREETFVEESEVRLSNNDSDFKHLRQWLQFAFPHRPILSGIKKRRESSGEKYYYTLTSESSWCENKQGEHKSVNVYFTVHRLKGVRQRCHCKCPEIGKVSNLTCEDYISPVGVALPKKLQKKLFPEQQRQPAHGPSRHADSELVKRNVEQAMTPSISLGPVFKRSRIGTDDYNQQKKELYSVIEMLK